MGDGNAADEPTRSRTGQHDDHAFRADIGAKAAPVAPIALDRDLPVGYRDGMVAAVAASRDAAAAGRAPLREPPDCKMTSVSIIFSQ